MQWDSEHENSSRNGIGELFVKTLINEISCFIEFISNNEESEHSTDGIDVWIRFKHRVEYVKLMLHCGFVVGAVLIGDTDLEETIENLILNRTNVSYYDINILKPDFEIDDYFD